MLIEPVDAGDDAVSLVGVCGGRKPRQQGLAAGVGLRSGLSRRRGWRRRRRVGCARGRGQSEQAEKDEERSTRHDGEPKASPRRGQNTIAAGRRADVGLSPDAP
jgi:hypothetical protein